MALLHFASSPMLQKRHLRTLWAPLHRVSPTCACHPWPLSVQNEFSTRKYDSTCRWHHLQSPQYFDFVSRNQRNAKNPSDANVFTRLMKWGHINVSKILKRTHKNANAACWSRVMTYFRFQVFFAGHLFPSCYNRITTSFGWMNLRSNWSMRWNKESVTAMNLHHDHSLYVLWKKTCWWCPQTSPRVQQYQQTWPAWARQSIHIWARSLDLKHLIPKAWVLCKALWIK